MEPTTTTTTPEKSSEGFSLKRSVFNDYLFIEALRELSKLPLEIKLAWNISRIIKQAQNVIDGGQKQIQEMLKKYAELDEKGKPKFDVEKNDFIFKDKEAFDVEYKAFCAEEFHFKSYKIKLDELTGTISPELIGALEPIIAA